MKTKFLRSVLSRASLASVAVLLATAPLLRAHDGHDSEAPDKPASVAAAFTQIHHLSAALTSQITGKNLKHVHETAEALAEVVAALPDLSKDSLPAEKLKRVDGAARNLAKALDALHDAADESNQAGAEKHLKTVDALLKLLTAQYPPEVLAATSTPPARIGTGGHSHAAPAAPVVQLAFRPATPPQAGARVPVVVRLTTKDGRPVSSVDLEIAHTKLVHLLIVDASLTSYTHEHPVETAPGEWSFDFKPKAGGTYTVFADLLPKSTGRQEYARTTVAVAGPALPLDQSTNLTATVDGYRFDLKIPANAPLTAGEASLVAVHVTRPDGAPCANLEPIMAAFAHGVGFTADLAGVLHVHPMGKEPATDDERGGPDLSFHLQPAAAGFFKFYVQVQLDGTSRFAGFGLVAAPAKPATPENAVADATYSCPMHPEVTATKARESCPKCGMQLTLNKTH